jgi:hypothetical protein
MGGPWEPQGAPLQSRMPITNRRYQPGEPWLRPGKVGGTVAAGTVIMLADAAVGPAGILYFNQQSAIINQQFFSFCAVQRAG